jgi:hypothetical protein
MRRLRLRAAQLLHADGAIVEARFDPGPCDNPSARGCVGEHRSRPRKRSKNSSRCGFARPNHGKTLCTSHTYSCARSITGHQSHPNIPVMNTIIKNARPAISAFG